MRNISIQELMEMYIDTLNKCGTYLLSADDTIIGYNIFEEFDTGVNSFFHTANLQKLIDAGLITNAIMEKSTLLRNLVIELQKGDKWNIDSVRNSIEWRKILELSDEIKENIRVQ